MSQLDLPAEALTGRTRELGFLQGFARETAVSGGALILSGDPGMGKTALLNTLADSALGSGTTVLRAAGLEFEGEVSFAALNQALFPLLGDLGELAGAHRDALRVALGFGAGPPPERLLVSTATLVLLRGVAARAPLLRGEWGEAAELAAEGLSVCEERGSRFFGWYFRYHQALLAAVQRRFDTSRGHHPDRGRARNVVSRARDAVITRSRPPRACARRAPEPGAGPQPRLDSLAVASSLLRAATRATSRRRT